MIEQGDISPATICGALKDAGENTDAMHRVRGAVVIGIGEYLHYAEQREDPVEMPAVAHIYPRGAKNM